MNTPKRSRETQSTEEQRRCWEAHYNRKRLAAWRARKADHDRRTAR